MHVADLFVYVTDLAGEIRSYQSDLLTELPNLFLLPGKLILLSGKLILLPVESGLHFLAQPGLGLGHLSAQLGHLRS